MLQTDASNTIFKLAADFVNNTSRHIFLTGKAGTGKTTFLKYIKEHTRKRTVIIAPTGVAAINAGGVTMHSFFQLPFGPFIPGTSRGFAPVDENVSDKHSLFKNIKFNSEKRTLIEELELLIIDEVSMVRADMLDAVDFILRHFRKKLLVPFGGVQMLFIGDMYQLPPVVPNNEWDILKAWYESPFFFSAKSIAEAPPLYIELKKIYRQNEQQFIDILNRVRNNQVSADDFLLLNKKYQPDFRPSADQKYITLSTHNKRADAINAAELEKLPGKNILFNGTVTGDFSDKALPTEMELQLKPGAQVMFIKNDSGGERKYFNGKLATIKTISKDEIIVTANDIDGGDLKVEKETWLNIRYNYNKENGRIEEEEMGSFTQYPIRLAWAITIHKSQGLTFEKAIIDAGASFAAGQVYVALSRCTSLDGLVLQSKLYPSAVSTDERVITFAKKEAAAEALQQILQNEAQQFLEDTLVKNFSWDKIVDAITRFKELVPGKKLPDIDMAFALSHTLFNKATALAATAEKFQLQLQQLLQWAKQSADTAVLEDRVNKAIVYFAKSIGEDLLQPLQQHSNSLQHAGKVRKYVTQVTDIETSLIQQLQRLTQVRYGDIVFCKDPSVFEIYYSKTNHGASGTKANKYKQIKGSSQAESLGLFKEGNTIAEIAATRQLAESTVSGHLSAFVRTGEIDVNELLPAETINIILPVVKEIGGDAVTPVKEILGDTFSYLEIRIVLNHWHWISSEKVNL